jgi:hypothetical protein
MAGITLYYTLRDQNSQKFLEHLNSCETLGNTITKINIDTLQRSPTRYVPALYFSKTREWLVGKKAFEWVQEKKVLDLCSFDVNTMAGSGALGFSDLNGGGIMSQGNFSNYSDFDKHCSGIYSDHA